MVRTFKTYSHHSLYSRKSFVTNSKSLETSSSWLLTALSTSLEALQLSQRLSNWKIDITSLPSPLTLWNDAVTAPSHAHLDTEDLSLINLRVLFLNLRQSEAVLKLHCYSGMRHFRSDNKVYHGGRGVTWIATRTPRTEGLQMVWN